MKAAMQYARLGRTGLIVSKLGFGAMTFGTASGALGHVHGVDQKLADRLVGVSLERGVTYFNCADVYADGASETILGKALSGKRKDVVLATKVGMRTDAAMTSAGLSRRHILQAADSSLRRLGTDYIDVYLAHRPDPHTPVEETLTAFDDLMRQGKIRYAGVSNWPTWEIAHAIGVSARVGGATFCASEMYYSLLGRDLEYEHLPMASALGVGVTVWSPLAGGLLSGKYRGVKPSPGEGRLSGFDFIPSDDARSDLVLSRLRMLSEQSGKSVAAIAIAWLLRRPVIASVLVGARNEQQLTDNFNALDVELDESEWQALEAQCNPPAIYPHWFVAKTSDRMADSALTMD